MDLSDARWFPVDLDVRDGRYAFLHLDDSVLETSSFLDTRIDAPLSNAMPSTVAFSATPAIASRVAWLFHTSFCGSTLLARVLHAPPWNVCLREPLVLRRIGDARHAGQDVSRILETTVALLSRPWNAGGSVTIKPTHAALNAAIDMMTIAPDSRALALTSSLDDFLVSNVKKPAESQAKIPLLAERAVQASGFHQRLPVAAFAPPDLLCAAVIQWAAQRELLMQIADSMGPTRMSIIDMDTLLSDLPSTARHAVEWLRLGIPDAELLARCRRESARNAKAVDAPYSASQRADDSRYIEHAFAPALTRARAWASTNVLPYMHPRAFDVVRSRN